MGKHAHRLLTSNDDGSGVCKFCGPITWAEYSANGKTRRGCPGTIENNRFCFNEGKVGPTGLRGFEARARLVDKVCEICGAPATANDHNHITGELRGVLCDGCNTRLAHLEKPGWLDAAMSYLSRYAPK